MKHLLAILLLAACAATGYGQTVKSLGYNTTNGEVVYSGTNPLTFTNAPAFSDAATVRTNLGLGTAATNAASAFQPAAAALTNLAANDAANLTNFPALLLRTNGSAAELTNFPTLNQNTTGTASNVTGVVALANGGTGGTNAAGARTNLGLGATWLTNTNAASFRTAIGTPAQFGSGTNSVIGGGALNFASGSASIVSGGAANSATGIASVVSGGEGNTASGNYATVSGGGHDVFPANGNVASGNWSWAGGRRSMATNNGAFVWADHQTNQFVSTNENSFNVRASGGMSLDLGTNGISFRSSTNADVTRTNLGIPLPALTNTSNVTTMRALAGSTNTNAPFSGSVSVVGTNNTNTMVFTNGILLEVTAP
jgi:hypothetical protein